MRRYEEETVFTLNEKDEKGDSSLIWKENTKNGLKNLNESR